MRLLLGALLTALVLTTVSGALLSGARADDPTSTASPTATADGADGATTEDPAAEDPAATATGQCAKPADRDDDTIHVWGCMKDGTTPIEGVAFTVTELDGGAEVGTGETNADGMFDINLGDAIDVLGNGYVVTMDTDTLPDGVDLRDPKKATQTLERIKLQDDVSLAFPIGAVAAEKSVLERAVQLSVSGLVFGVLLALAALGLSLIFGTTGLTNFAHGELITFGAMSAFWVDQLSGEITVGGVNITMGIAIVFAIVMSVAFGWVQDKALWKPLRSRGTGLIAAMIVSIGFSIMLRNVYQFFLGADAKTYSQWSTQEPWTLGPVSIKPAAVIVTIFAALVLAAVVLGMQRTRIGRAARAVSDNPALASASGINVDRVISTMWALGAGLAGLSGVLLGITQGFDYQLGFKILLLVFAAVVLGGLGSIGGAIAGALIIGVFIDVSTLVIPPELKFVGALGVLILVLLFRPQGLFGRAQRIG